MLIQSFQGRPATLIRVAGLLAVCWSVIASDQPPSTHGRGLVILIALVVCAIAWIQWTFAIATRLSLGSGQSLSAEIYVLAVGGGVLTAACPGAAASAFVFVAVVSGSMRVGIVQTLPVLAAAMLALCMSALIYSQSALSVLAYGLGFLVAMLAAANARDSVIRAEQAELLLAQSQRSHEEQLRSARLQESTRIAREIHDVLAHTLSGLTIQLEATEALIAQGADPQTVSARVHRAHELAREGLLETRRAVGALRDDGGAGGSEISDRLAALCADRGEPGEPTCELRIEGEVEKLSPLAGEAVVRTVQEALTNVSKHARGAAVSVTLKSGDDVRLTIENGPAATQNGAAVASLARSGGGYGLQGMRERAEELGGEVKAGPVGRGWLVELQLPNGGTNL